MDDKMTTLIRVQIKKIIVLNNRLTVEEDVDQIETLTNKHAKEFGNFIIREKYTNSFNELFHGKQPEILTTEQCWEKFKKL